MNDIATLNELIDLVSEREKLDIVYNEILFPRLKNTALNFKAKEYKINDNCHDTQMGIKLERIMGRSITLQSLVETQMKPYLEEKGYSVGIISPKYFVYVRW
jgi:hypothetical protein